MSVTLKDLQLIYGVAGAREKFEDLCSLLIKGEFPDAKSIRVYRGDGGVDTADGAWGGDVTVFQQKYFLTGIGQTQQEEIRQSFKRARDNQSFTLKKWVLCLPINLSTEEQAWFDGWKSRQDGYDIELWGELTLLRLLLAEKNRGIKEAYFKEEHLSQIREIHTELMDIIENFRERFNANGGHDLEVYRQTTESLGRPFLDFLTDLEDDLAYEPELSSRTRDYLYGWSTDPENTFIHSDMEAMRERLAGTLAALTSFIAINFSRRDGDNADNRRYLNPDINPALKRVITDEDASEFNVLRANLERCVEQARQAYLDFISTCKKVLSAEGSL